MLWIPAPPRGRASFLAREGGALGVDMTTKKDDSSFFLGYIGEFTFAIAQISLTGTHTSLGKSKSGNWS